MTHEQNQSSPLPEISRPIIETRLAFFLNSENLAQMAVETLNCFPELIVAGDTVRILHSDGDYPATSWTLKVSIQGDTITKTVDATASGTSHSIIIPSATTALLAPPGLFTVRYSYTSGGERVTSEEVALVTVLADPTVQGTPSVARQTLTAMQAAALLLAADTDATVSFNGQTFTGKSLPELQKAIEHQKAIVAIEDRRRTGRGGIRRILNTA